MRKMANSINTFIFVLISYGLLTLVYFFPILGRLSTHLIGPPEDNMQFLWFLWYGAKSLVTPNLDFFHTHMIYYPEGMSLYFANYFYVGVFAALLLKPFLSLVQTYNLLVLAGFLLSGLAAFYLIYEITKDRTASFIGGFVYAFNPQHFAKSLHHAHLSSIEFIPLFILFLIRSRSKSSFSNIFLTAAFLSLAALCDWNYLVYGLLILAFELFYTHAEQKKIFILEAWSRTIRTGLCAFLLLSFIMIPMIRMSISYGGDRPALPGIDIYVADLAAFFVPYSQHLIANWAPLIKAINLRMTGNAWEGTAYLGLINLVLAAIFLIRRPGQARFFGWMLGFCVLLAMGVRVHFLGALEHISIPLPYQLLQDLPFFKYARNPARIMPFAYLSLAILVGGGISVLLSRIGKQKRVKTTVAGLLFMVIFIDFFQTTGEATPVKLPSYYTDIQKDYAASSATPFGIINIPWEQARFLMYQTLHEIPDAQGYLGHKFGRPLIGRIPFDLRYLSVQKKLLQANRVKYVILHKKRLRWDPGKPEDLAFWLRMSHEAKSYAAIYEQVFNDSDTAVFRVYQ